MPTDPTKQTDPVVEARELPRYARCDKCTDIFCGYLIEHYRLEFEECTDECETGTTLDRYLGDDQWIDVTVREDGDDDA